MTAWHAEAPDDSELPDVHLADLELAWRAWTLMEATDWHYLPHIGGLLDQPAALMGDILTIADRSRRIRKQVKGGK